MNQQPAIQDQIPNNHCFGCGPCNPNGLQIKSYWSGENESVCTFTPAAHHSAGPVQFLNGGIISTVIDCHCICTAIAKGYQLSGREIGTGDIVWYATGTLTVQYLKPVPIDKDVRLQATINEVADNKITLTCELWSEGELCCTSTVVAVKVPSHWLDRTGK
ncbi:PaaI family thioesterase [Vibrio sp.]|uniref:PaaI family thioesterase n=1 Tax=Vibrio sp. TaxID=678 RepID=UPI003D0CF96A